MLGDLTLTKSWIFRRSPPLQTLGSEKRLCEVGVDNALQD